MLPSWKSPDLDPQFTPRQPDPGLGDYFAAVGEDMLYHSPTSGLIRYNELSYAKQGFGNTLPFMEPDELNAKFGIPGQLEFNEPMYGMAAWIMKQRKEAEINREFILSSGARSGGRVVGGFAVGMAASMLDPINLASMFVPVSKLGVIKPFIQARKTKAGQRIAQGAIEGFVGQAMVEPLVLLPAMQEQSNYNYTDSLVNLGLSPIAGAAVHTGFGVISDVLTKMLPGTKEKMVEATLTNLVSDEKVDVSPIALLDEKVVEETALTRLAHKQGKSLSELLSEESVLDDAINILAKEKGISSDELSTTLDGLRKDTSGDFVLPSDVHTLRKLELELEGKQKDATLFRLREIALELIADRDGLSLPKLKEELEGIIDAKKDFDFVLPSDEARFKKLTSDLKQEMSQVRKEILEEVSKKESAKTKAKEPIEQRPLESADKTTLDPEAKADDRLAVEQAKTKQIIQTIAEERPEPIFKDTDETLDPKMKELRDKYGFTEFDELPENFKLSDEDMDFIDDVAEELSLLNEADVDKATSTAVACVIGSLK